MLRVADGQLDGTAVWFKRRVLRARFAHGAKAGEGVECGRLVVQYLVSIGIGSVLLDAICKPCIHVPRGLADLGARVLVLCQEGYTSSLAADSLQRIGVHRATDVIGGFRAWRAAGLPATRAR